MHRLLAVSEVCVAARRHAYSRSDVLHNFVYAGDPVDIRERVIELSQLSFLPLPKWYNIWALRHSFQLGNTIK